MIPRSLGLLGAAFVSIATLAGAAAYAGASPSTTVRTTTDGAPPPAVEDFGYPDAARIKADQGITLKRGDGSITLAACDSNATNQIQVWTRETTDGRFCFRSTSSRGWLTLEVPEVYAIATEARAVRAELSAEGKNQTVNVAKGEFKGVGEGVGDTPTVLLELRVTG